MRTYSQNQEDLFILKYFGNYKGTLLEIGANDGQTLSNSLMLIEFGWKAHLVEPGNVFEDLAIKHAGNPNVTLHNFGIGKADTTVPFFESGAHVKNGNDRALVSSVDYSETKRWRDCGVEFIEHEIQLVSWATFVKDKPNFDFISIDAEGHDWIILQQIELNKVGCKCLCVEHNGDVDLKLKYIEYCLQFDLHPKVINNENIIFTK